MEHQSRNIAPYAKSAVKLLQGPVFEDQQDVWNEMLQYQVELTQYFERIAFDVLIDKRDGLREWLLEFESSDLETANLYITPKEFRDRMEMFFKEKANELKFIKESH
ncbi:DUF4194 domain-containing protein [Algoriphagus sp. AGSA1]|uniref:DUF4194 domain-containing protein n=1 Tax=Algoriphagus sp. AGSA1 TaxID=2907213 RepID=UPI001F2D3747|nr:DUF4194 domain-containing protein [Algoriphagus sp. AGSA1]MCE7054296.1 DUF4194 domain-containing protein [Algoriphagus sp. AGSA1]